MTFNEQFNPLYLAQVGRLVTCSHPDARGLHGQVEQVHGFAVPMLTCRFYVPLDSPLLAELGRATLMATVPLRSCQPVSMATFTQEVGWPPELVEPSPVFEDGVNMPPGPVPRFPWVRAGAPCRYHAHNGTCGLVHQVRNMGTDVEPRWRIQVRYFHGLDINGQLMTDMSAWHGPEQFVPVPLAEVQEVMHRQGWGDRFQHRDGDAIRQCPGCYQDGPTTWLDCERCSQPTKPGYSYAGGFVRHQYWRWAQNGRPPLGLQEWEGLRLNSYERVLLLPWFADDTLQAQLHQATAQVERGYGRVPRDYSDSLVRFLLPELLARYEAALLVIQELACPSLEDPAQQRLMQRVDQAQQSRVSGRDMAKPVCFVPPQAPARPRVAHFDEGTGLPSPDTELGRTIADAMMDEASVNGPILSDDFDDRAWGEAIIPDDAEEITTRGLQTVIDTDEPCEVGVELRLPPEAKQAINQLGLVTRVTNESDEELP